jgi:hypothetical protein
METIYEPNSSFDYSKLSLGQPQSTQGGSYFTKILFDNKPLYCQFPRCKTKQGIIQTDKKIYSDLLYDTNIHNELSNWIENLETECQKLIFEKRHLWFQNELELSEIESAFNTCSRMYKSGKQFLIRCYIPKPSTLLNTTKCIIYDENEHNLTLNHVDITKEIIPLLKIEGIKFTNRNFQIEIHISQIMVMNDMEEPKSCLIKRKNAGSTIEIDQVKESHSLHNKTITSNNIGLNNNVIKDINIEKLTSECLETLETSDIEEEHSNDSEEYNEENNEDDDKDDYKENIDYNDENHLEVINDRKNKKSEDLEVVQLNFDDIEDTVVLRKRNEVYYEIYKKARDKAKLAKKAAIDAYLEAKNIKSRYMLNDLDESDDDDLNFEN